MAVRRTRVLTQGVLRGLLTMEMAVEAVEAAFAAFGRGDAVMPPKVYVDMPDLGGDFRAMPARLEGTGGVKWVNSHPGNPARFGLPSVMGVYVLSDAATAFPRAILDATLLTAARTGAAAAVATKFLHGAPTSLGYVGCGVQARTMHGAFRAAFGELPPAVCADANGAAAEAFAREIGGRVGTLEEAAGQDVVNTSTPVKEPIVRAEWLAEGAHVNAMGADGPGKRELDPEVLARAAVYVDDWEQASHSGEIHRSVEDGSFGRDDLAGNLGDVVAGVAARPEAGTLTLFDSTGLAIQDLALAERLVAEAEATRAGLAIDLVGLRTD
ncbi:MAG: ornithine cyclodeaminase family protein [Myxococcota bacterium]